MSVKQILVVSDSHGSADVLKSLCCRYPQITTVLHAGDGSSDVEALMRDNPLLSVFAVRGNCDYDGDFLPDEELFTVDGVKIFLTHGHRFGVKYDYGTIMWEAKNRGADIVVFGHTHRSECEQRDGIWMLNPGSLSRSFLSRGSYAIIEINDGRAFCSLMEVTKNK